MARHTIYTEEYYDDITQCTWSWLTVFII